MGETSMTKTELVDIIRDEKKTFFSIFTNRIESQICGMIHDIAPDEIIGKRMRLDEFFKANGMESFAAANLNDYKPEDEQIDVDVYEWLDSDISGIRYILIHYLGHVNGDNPMASLEGHN